MFEVTKYFRKKIIFDKKTMSKNKISLNNTILLFFSAWAKMILSELTRFNCKGTAK